MKRVLLSAILLSCLLFTGCFPNEEWQDPVYMTEIHMGERELTENSDTLLETVLETETLARQPSKCVSSERCLLRNTTVADLSQDLLGFAVFGETTIHSISVVDTFTGATLATEDFGAMVIGVAPPGWTILSGNWTVVAEPNSPSGKALRQNTGGAWGVIQAPWNFGIATSWIAQCDMNLETGAFHPGGFAFWFDGANNFYSYMGVNSNHNQINGGYYTLIGMAYTPLSADYILNAGQTITTDSWFTLKIMTGLDTCWGYMAPQGQTPQHYSIYGVGPTQWIFHDTEKGAITNVQLAFPNTLANPIAYLDVYYDGHYPGIDAPDFSVTVGSFMLVGDLYRIGIMNTRFINVSHELPRSVSRSVFMPYAEDCNIVVRSAVAAGAGGVIVNKIEYIPDFDTIAGYGHYMMSEKYNETVVPGVFEEIFTLTGEYILADIHIQIDSNPADANGFKLLEGDWLLNVDNEQAYSWKWTGTDFFLGVLGNAIAMNATPPGEFVGVTIPNAAPDPPYEIAGYRMFIKTPVKCSDAMSLTWTAGDPFGGAPGANLTANFAVGFYVP